jgi:ABC-type lipoprotein release transport system permease subunit
MQAENVKDFLDGLPRLVGDAMETLLKVLLSYLPNEISAQDVVLNTVVALLIVLLIHVCGKLMTVSTPFHVSGASAR